MTGRLFLRAVVMCIPIAICTPCSIFTYQNDTDIYFCGNEDWTATDVAIMSIPAKGSAHGVILFGWDSYLPKYAQAGINDVGLCFDWAVVSPQIFTPDKKKPSLSIDDTLTILQNCHTVQEVIDFVQKHDFPHLATEHIMFADASGDACVLEYAKGSYHTIRKTNSFLVVTNFNLTDPKSGWYPCTRYNHLQSSFTETKTDPTTFVSLLDAVHQEGAYSTTYSYILNLQTMQIQLFYRHDFTKSASFDVSSLLKKQQKFLLADTVH